MAGTNRKPLQVMILSIPEPRFPCEGEDFGSNKSSEIHNRFTTGTTPPATSTTPT